ncbi:MAG: hypothetical protein L3J74_12305 [Bacteroidales bacterium]|nr:hypothetical protein [Bacteroidales bacterium]
MIKQKLHKVISIVLLLIFAFPLIYQPAHYFIVHHDNVFLAHHHPNQLTEQHSHIFCTIDDFQITELLPHNFINFTRKQNICTELNFVYPTVFVKNIYFSNSFLRAPPKIG